MESSKPWQILRSTTLIVLVGFATLLISGCEAAEKSQNYPPYPAVWDWMPDRTNTERGFSTLRLMRNGDVLVTYVSRREETPPAMENIAFFGRTSFPSVEAVFDGQFRPNDDHKRISLPDGMIVEGMAYTECTRGVGSQVIVRSSSGEVMQSKTFLLLLKEPIQSESVECEETEQPGFQSRLSVLRPTGLLALADGTFLVVDGISGVVLRLDQNLDIKSSRLGTEIFAMSPEQLEQELRARAKMAPDRPVDWKPFFEALQLRLIQENTRK